MKTINKRYNKRSLIMALTFTIIFLGQNAFSQVKVIDNSLGINDETPYPTLQIIRAGSSNNLGLLIGYYGNDIQGRYGSNSNNNGDLILNKWAGNVGIRTSTPSYPLTVNGKIWCSELIEGSDSSLKTNINAFDSARVNDIFNIEGKTYEFKQEKPISATKFRNDTVIEEEKTEPRIKFGFLAQDVKKYYPELVFEDNEGVLGVNYNGFIPILLETLKKQEKEIKNLEKKIKDIKDKTDKLEKSVKKIAMISGTKPSHFAQDLYIEYYLSNEIDEATICIYDLQGKQLISRSIDGREEGRIQLNGQELDPGMYKYSLLADGELVDVQTLVLTN